jgi:septal ring-binding cell division protein DamX
MRTGIAPPRGLTEPTPMPRPSFFPLYISAALVVACAAGATNSAQAQTRSTRRVVTPDSVYARAKQLVVNGNGAAGRVLVDSMVAAADPDTPAYADALYWRASLSTSISDAERDLRKIVIEYPLAPRNSDALLQLGQLEAARGERPAASTHLERFLLENPTSPEQGRAGLLLVRVSFEQNDARHGCIALTRALHAVPADAVELRNQLQYYSPRCAGVDTTNAPKPAAIARGTVVARGAAKTAKPPKDSAAPPSQTSKGEFTLQVAAYSSKTEANALALKLKKRGLDTRVVGTTKLFRVRIGHYATRAAATAAAKQLKTRKIDAFVTPVGNDDT